MISFRTYLIEEQPVSWLDLKRIKAYLDKILAGFHMEFSFTKHFLDRVNDARNKTQITVGELISLLKDEFQKYGQKFKFMKPGTELLFKSMKSDINVPVAFDWDKNNNELNVVAKTIMRKKNFLSSTPKYVVA